jgi:hypothetical protein
MGINQFNPLEPELTLEVSLQMMTNGWIGTPTFVSELAADYGCVMTMKMDEFMRLSDH